MCTPVIRRKLPHSFNSFQKELKIFKKKFNKRKKGAIKHKKLSCFQYTNAGGPIQVIKRKKWLNEVCDGVHCLFPHFFFFNIILIEHI